MSEEQNTEQVADTTEQNTEQATTENQNSASKENWIPQSRFNEVNEKKKQAEQTLEDVAKEFVNEVPEQFQDMIPNLSPAEKIKWIKSAQQKGLFTAKAQDGPDNETPGPSNTEVDTSQMSAFQKLQNGFK